MERASSNFQYGALLLSDHADVLCERLHADAEDDGVARPMQLEENQTATHVSVSRKAKKMRESKKRR